MARKILIAVWVMVLLAGCVAPATPVSLPAGSTPVIEKTSTPTIVPQLSVTSTSTSTSTSGIELVKQCLRTENRVMTLKDVTTGTILQDGSLLDIQTGIKHLLPSKSAEIVADYGSQVSPNGDMFAYIEPIQNDQLNKADNILWVVDARANALAQIPITQINRSELHGDDLIEPRWLDNERLLIYTNQTYQDLSVLVVNPFTGEQKLISNEFPMLVDKNDIPFMPWVVEYSPDLSWLVYLGGPGGVNVYDALTKENLWQPPSPSGIGKPVWSPDGQQVAIMGAGQLYLVNRSGQAKPILDEKENKQVWAPSWSPDGRKIAFWNLDNLMVYDQQMGKVIDLCISNQPSTIAYPARWSPDSMQLMIREQTRGVASDGALLPIIIDLQKSAVSKNLSDGQNIRGEVWMNSLP